MFESWTIVILPTIGAFIGWVTNYVAVKMLFHPKEPKKFLFLTVQGVFPKRQRAFAHKLGAVVSGELFSADDVKSLLREGASSPKLRAVIDQHIEAVITEKLPKAIPMLAMVMNPQLVQTVKGTFSAELNELLVSLVDALGSTLDEALDVHAIIEEKVAAFSSDKLEQILLAIMSKEFRFIELVGAVLGGLIGVVQVLLVGS
jgi:uncharacterized membrane protein YheB (UPF0754 family)